MGLYPRTLPTCRRTCSIVSKLVRCRLLIARRVVSPPPWSIIAQSLLAPRLLPTYVPPYSVVVLIRDKMPRLHEAEEHPPRVAGERVVVVIPLSAVVPLIIKTTYCAFAFSKTLWASVQQRCRTRAGRANFAVLSDDKKIRLKRFPPPPPARS